MSIGHTDDGARFQKVWPGKLSLVQIGEIFGYGEYKDELDPLRWLEMSAPGHFDPPPRTQIFLPEDDDRQK